MAIRPKLVLAGGGHAILPFLNHAKEIDDSADITLINENRYLYFSGMIPEYLGGTYNEEDIRIDLEGLCHLNKVTFVQARAIKLNVEDRLLTCSDNQTFTYDLLIFDIGSIPPPGSAFSNAVPIKPFFRLIDLNSALLQSTIKNMLITGGGAAGVEIALNISARKQKELMEGTFSIHLVEQAKRLLPSFSGSMSNYATKLLLKRGTKLYLSSTIRRYDNNRVELTSGNIIDTDYLLWATGTESQPLFRNAGLPVDEKGNLKVNARLQCPEHPEIFAAGDCAHLISYPSLSKIGVHAVKQGPPLKNNLFTIIKSWKQQGAFNDKKLRTFKPYPVSPLILSAGKKDAIWTAGNFWIHHPFMLYLKHFIDRRWIRQYQQS